MQTMELDLWRERRAELLREAENERLARRLRAGDRRSGARGFWKRVGAWTRPAPRRSVDEAVDVEVRWGTPEDEEKIGELLELNGAPRGVATGEGFVVAERVGECWRLCATGRNPSCSCWGCSPPTPGPRSVPLRRRCTPAPARWRGRWAPRRSGLAPTGARITHPGPGTVAERHGSGSRPMGGGARLDLAGYLAPESAPYPRLRAGGRGAYERGGIPAFTQEERNYRMKRGPRFPGANNVKEDYEWLT